MSMDEQQSGNLADETTEMMSETVAHQNEELRKRRSTRIMQAVPLAVTGVDALGRPFTERTSTLIINCHGCRYQSKHYVLKNMWVTLEVPHPESRQPPRTVRGRVAWIQRPRTVRQLFQVALELETPGNTWGIAFPPPDWFAPSESVRVSAYQGAVDVSAKPPDTSEIRLPLTEPEAGGAPAPMQDNLRVFPAPASATDASLQLARHMARLVADAKQQIQATAREVAAHAVSAERRLSMEEWTREFSVAREQLAKQVSAAIEKIQEETDARSRTAHAAAADALQRELPRWIAPQLEELTRELTQQISDRGTAERTEQSQQFASALESLRTLCQQAEEASARLNAQMQQAENQVSQRTSELIHEVDEAARQRDVAGNAHREAMSTAAGEIEQQITAALSAAHASWRSQLNNEVEAAQARWQATIESTRLTAQERAVAGIDEHVHTLLSRVQEEAEHRAAVLRESMNNAAAEAEQRAASLRNSLQEETARQAAAVHESISSAAAEAEKRISGLQDSARELAERHTAAIRESISRAAAETEQRVAGMQNELKQQAEKQAAAIRESLGKAVAETEDRLSSLRSSLREQSEWLEAALGRAAESTERLEHFSARTETAQQQAFAGFESQIDDVVSLHRNELHRRSETFLEEINARIRHAFEENSLLALSRFEQQAEALVQPHIAKTEEAIHRLAGGRSLLDAAMTLQQDRIRTSADEAFAESLAAFRENLGGVEQLLQDAAQGVAARNLAEIETRAADLKHQTVDDLMKSAEWYEKKAQTQIQSHTEKTVEQAENKFREKAGEVSSVFASELDHSSRSFIGHTQTQMEEVVRDAFNQARALFAEAAETTTAAFTDEIQRQARQELDGFGEEARRSLGETRVQLDAARNELAQRVTAEQEAFLRQFHAGMSSAVERGVADASLRVKEGMSPLLESWRSTVETHRTEMRNIYSQLGEQAAEQHRGRLENISVQWMLASVASLDHQSREAIAGIASKAEETLRETCAQVFANVGDALRDRLQAIAANLAVPDPPLKKSQTAGGSER